MEKQFWLRRQSESVEMAASATSAEARLIHLDLAGRYGARRQQQPRRRAALGEPLEGGTEARS